MNGLHSDPMSNEYDDIMIVYMPLRADIDNDNIKKEGDILYSIIFNLFKSLNKQFLH